MTESLVQGTSDIATLLKNGASRLAQLPSGRLDSELLLGHVLRCDRVALFRDSDRVISTALRDQFNAMVAARARGQPLAYLRGVQEFWSLSLHVNEHVLVPRSETELLVSTALSVVPESRPPRIADLGTGSGAVGLALASELQQASVIALDRSSLALRVARVNRVRCGLDNVMFLQSDWLAAVADQAFDIIVANPPYVAADDPLLTESDLRYEPRQALASGFDGLDALTGLATQAPRALTAGGWLIMEHGSTHGLAVRSLYSAAGLIEISTLRDLAGLDRVTIGQKSPHWMRQPNG